MWVFAGRTASGASSDDLWRLDLEAGAVLARACELIVWCYPPPPVQAHTWLQVPRGVGPWPKPRRSHTGVVDAAGWLWIHAGLSESDGYFNDWWSFDTQAGERSCSKI